MGKNIPKLPDEYMVPNPYNLPIHDQRSKKNCTSHAFAAMVEYHLSDYFKEQTLIDVDDLWEKQKKYGTATDEGDLMDGPYAIATKYGARFKTGSGKTGTMFLTGQKERQGIFTIYKGWRIRLDRRFNPSKFLRKIFVKKPKLSTQPKHLAYDQEITKASLSGHKTINNDRGDMTIDYKDSRLSPIIEQSLSPITELGIQLFDAEKTAQEIAAVNLKYEKELKSGEVGRFGIGGPGEIVGFFVDAAIKFTILWIGKHIITDFDDAIWAKLKNALFLIFKSTQLTLRKSEITITTNYKPQIIFVFPSDVGVETFLQELNTLVKMTKEILEANPDSRIAYKYTFNAATSVWELETTKLNVW